MGKKRAEMTKVDVAKKLAEVWGKNFNMQVAAEICKTLKYAKSDGVLLSYEEKVQIAKEIRRLFAEGDVKIEGSGPAEDMMEEGVGLILTLIRVDEICCACGEDFLMEALEESYMG